MKKNSGNVRNDIYRFLKGNGIMTLATCGDNQPWACTVYYGIDEEMNMYIVTDPGSDHGRHLAKNKNVAFNVFDSRQPITKPKKGVQGRGICEQVRGIVNITRGLLLWHKANPGIEGKITIKDILKKLKDTKVYKIIPTYLKYFNKELYGTDEYGILEL